MSTATAPSRFTCACGFCLHHHACLVHGCCVVLPALTCVSYAAPLHRYLVDFWMPFLHRRLPGTPDWFTVRFTCVHAHHTCTCLPHSPLCHAALLVHYPFYYATGFFLSFLPLSAYHVGSPRSLPRTANLSHLLPLAFLYAAARFFICCHLRTASGLCLLLYVPCLRTAGFTAFSATVLLSPLRWAAALHLPPYAPFRLCRLPRSPLVLPPPRSCLLDTAARSSPLRLPHTPSLCACLPPLLPAATAVHRSTAPACLPAFCTCVLLTSPHLPLRCRAVHCRTCRRALLPHLHAWVYACACRFTACHCSPVLRIACRLHFPVLVVLHRSAGCLCLDSTCAVRSAACLHHHLLHTISFLYTCRSLSLAPLPRTAVLCHYHHRYTPRLHLPGFYTAGVTSDAGISFYRVGYTACRSYLPALRSAVFCHHLPAFACDTPDLRAVLPDPIYRFCTADLFYRFSACTLPACLPAYRTAFLPHLPFCIPFACRFTPAVPPAVYLLLLAAVPARLRADLCLDRRYLPSRLPPAFHRRCRIPPLPPGFLPRHSLRLTCRSATNLCIRALLPAHLLPPLWSLPPARAHMRTVLCARSPPPPSTATPASILVSCCTAVPSLRSTVCVSLIPPQIFSRFVFAAAFYWFSAPGSVLVPAASAVSAVGFLFAAQPACTTSASLRMGCA